MCQFLWLKSPPTICTQLGWVSYWSFNILVSRERCHLHGVSGCFVRLRYSAILEFRVDGPRDGGKRYTAFKNTGGGKNGVVFLHL